MKKINCFLMVLIAASMIISGCKGAKQDKAPEGSSKVLATVNGENITEADLQVELAGKPDNFLKIATTPEGKKMLTERMIERKLLMQTAKKEGIAENPEIEKRLNAYKDRLIIEELRKKIMASPAPATDQQIEAYYNEHKSQYSTPEMARVRRIIMGDKESADKIYKELKAAPGKFEEIAKQSSQDELTKNRGGDMGFAMKSSDAQARMRSADPGSLQKNSIPDELASKVFGMKKDEVSPVMEYQGKYYIFQFLEKRPGEDKSFDQVKEQIKRTMEYEGTQSKWKEYVEGLKRNAQITMTDQGEPGTSNPIETRKENSKEAPMEAPKEAPDK